MVLSEALTGWFFDLATCFIVIGFIFSVKSILIMSKNANFTWKDLARESATLFNGGQASLLVVAYNITIIRSMLNLKYIRYFRNFLITVWVIIIIYNIIIYILVKEVGYIEDEKVTHKISFVFLLISIFGSLIYTIVQALV